MRTFSPYEKTQLAKYGISEALALTKGEMPVEYITGFVPFGDFELEVNQEVLIPRVETEELVLKAVEQIRIIWSTRQQLQNPDSTPLQIADVGTGSGALGISIAHQLAQLQLPFALTLSDVSETAVEVAKRNWERLVATPATILVSDLLVSYPTDQKYDLMVANLPYIPTPRIQVLDASVVDFEPHLALDGGPEGLTLIEAFLKQAESRLSQDALIILEIDYTHAHDVMQLNTKYVGQVDDDSFGQPRFALLRPAA